MKPVLRRVAGLALLLGAIFLGGRLLGVWGEGPVPVEVHYLVGDPPRARALEVDFRVKGETVATFQTELIVPDVKQATRLPSGPIQAQIVVVTPAGDRVRVLRDFQAERNVVVRFDLAHEVR